MPQCLIALGGNIGDVRRTFSSLYNRLDEDRRITRTKTASCYETEAIGADAGSNYWNSAIEIETDLPPLELLDALERFEREFGRSSKGDRGPRPLDLDLLFYGEEILWTPRLQVPHSASWYRRFVLDPVCEIAPEFFHPVKQVRLSQLRERLLSRPFRLGIAGGGNDEKQRLCESLRLDFPQIEISPIDFLDDEEIEKYTILAWLGDKEISTRTFSFEELPLVSRLDLSIVPQDRTVFLKDVLNSALDL